jgi:hypothetical protein
MMVHEGEGHAWLSSSMIVIRDNGREDQRTSTPPFIHHVIPRGTLEETWPVLPGHIAHCLYLMRRVTLKMTTDGMSRGSP